MNFLARTRSALLTAALSGALVAVAPPANAEPATAPTGSAPTASTPAASTEVARADDRHSETRIEEKGFFVASWYAAFGSQILHVDTEHETENGFWFAYADSFGISEGAREIKWAFQPNTVWCDSDQEVTWNAFLNAPLCDYTTAQYAADVAACRTEPDQEPWTRPAYAREDNGDLTAIGCDSVTAIDTKLLRMFTAPPTKDIRCAPWEDQSPLPAPRVGKKCEYTTYPWITNPEPEVFIGAPDACTGMPADTMRFRPYRDPRQHAAVGAPDSCDGSALAPNCTTGDDSRYAACGAVGTYYPATGDDTVPTDPGSGGGGEENVTATVTRTATEFATATRTVSQSVAVRIKRTSVTARVSRVVDGRTYRASATAPVFKDAFVTASATLTRGAERTRSATRSCTAATQAAAQECAAQSAQSAAVDAAAAAALAGAGAEARTAATSQAEQRARAQAVQKASEAPVTRADRRAAYEVALRRARVKLRAMLA